MLTSQRKRTAEDGAPGCPALAARPQRAASGLRPPPPKARGRLAGVSKVRRGAQRGREGPRASGPRGGAYITCGGRSARSRGAGAPEVGERLSQGSESAEPRKRAHSAAVSVQIKFPIARHLDHSYAGDRNEPSGCRQFICLTGRPSPFLGNCVSFSWLAVSCRISEMQLNCVCLKCKYSSPALCSKNTVC